MRILNKLLFVAGLALLTASSPAMASEVRTLEPGQKSPPANLDDLAWLEGIWIGKGIGGAPATEVYSAPQGGQIVGHFTQTGDDGVSFYEILTIVPRGGSLVYRLKHFNADLEGWEAKGADQAEEFALVAREGDAWYFDGLTLRKDGENGFVTAVRVERKEGPPGELVFRYIRKQ